jgi:hypothetical protein
VARTGWLSTQLSPQQLLDRQLITGADLLSALYAEEDAALGSREGQLVVVLQAVVRSIGQ